MKYLSALLATLCLAFASVAVHAQVDPVPVSTDGKVVVFSYEENTTYTILALPNYTVHIQLAPDEKVSHMVMGDTLQWIRANTKDGKNIFLKPVRNNIVTNGQLVTNKRSYQFNFVASPEGGKRYQKVSWQYPDVILAEVETEARTAVEEAKELARLEGQNITPPLSVESLNFAYRVKGDADFRPLQVFDDGKFTYLRFPNLQELPALFLVDDDGARLVNFIVKGQYVVVQRMVNQLVLKLGRNEVSIRKQS